MGGEHGGAHKHLVQAQVAGRKFAHAPGVSLGVASSAIHHFGPDPAHVGGMGSVIRVLQEHRLGGDAVTIHPTWQPKARIASAALALRGALRIPLLRRTDIVHVHLAEGGSFVREGLLVALARLWGHVTVATIHGANFLQFAHKHRRLAAAVLRRAHLITCLDRAVLSHVTEIAQGAEVALVPNPVAVDEEAPGADQTDEVVLFAGEIGLRKGADVLWRAWRTVSAARPQARCIMVGPERDFVVPAAERLEVRGTASSEEMKKLLRMARVVVLPSRAEGMPMILTEAMGGGRPFVSTPVGGIPDLAGEGGMLVDPEDASGLARCLTKLLADPSLARAIGERGRAFCRQTRSVDVIGARLSELYAVASSRA